MKNLAQAIPAKIRTVIYSILAMAVGIEAIVDVVPADVACSSIEASDSTLGSSSDTRCMIVNGTDTFG